MGRGQRQFESALQGITIGVVKDQEDLRALKEADGLIEVEEQVHLEFGGLAEEFSIWSEVDVVFSMNFVDATGQRDSPFDRPHFTFGAVLSTPDPVAVHVVVLGWRTNDRNETVGATVAIGVLATDRAVKVRGEVHMTFQGFGYAPTETPDDVGSA